MPAGRSQAGRRAREPSPDPPATHAGALGPPAPKRTPPPGALPSGGEAGPRYRGQSFGLAVPLGGDLVADFHRAHEERYGHADRTRPIELVGVRTADIRPGPEITLPPGEPMEVSGPALVELDG